MPTSSLSKRKPLHIAVDVLDVYAGPLCAARADLLQRIQAFAQDISPYIPTMWVSNCVRPDDLLYVRSLEDRTRARRVGQYRLLCRPVSENDLFANKNGKSVFSNRAVADYIAAMGPKPLLFISGLNTLACVKDSIVDALRSGCRVVAIEDCLGDSNLERKNPLSPRQHADMLANSVEAGLVKKEVDAEQKYRDRHPQEFPSLRQVTVADVMGTVTGVANLLEPMAADRAAAFVARSASASRRLSRPAKEAFHAACDL